MSTEPERSTSLAEAYEALQIVDGDERVVVEVEETVIPTEDYQFAAVGRVVTDRPIKFVVFRDVQNLPPGFMSEKVARVIGNHVGAYEAADDRNFDGELACEPVMEGKEKAFGSWLRAGGRRQVATPANRWLVLDPKPVQAGEAEVTTVTDGNTGTLKRNDIQLMRHLEPLIPLSTVINPGVITTNTGIINEEGEGEGVVIMDQKRRRVVNESNERRGDSGWSSPMSVEGQNVVHVLLGFVYHKKPDIIFLSETLCGSSNMERIPAKLGYANCFVVEAEDRSGGLALLWNGGLDVEVVGYSNHYIDTQVVSGVSMPRWRFTRFYGYPERHLYLGKERGSPSWVQEKLDRILVSGEWRDVFPNAKAWSLEGSSSDHMPLLLCVNSIGRRWYPRRPRFENSWGNDPRCREVVGAAWAWVDGADIGEKLLKCGKEVWQWGRKQVQGEVRALKHCKERMASLQNERGERGVREFGEVQREYLSLVQNQSDRWRQRAKELWYSGGDSNSHFFHNSVNGRWRRNAIRGVRDETGVLVTEVERMGGIFVNYFADLFTAKGGECKGVLEGLERRVTADQNNSLLREVTHDEVKGAIFAMHPDKSPGPDGLSPAFYQLHWDILGDEVVFFCHSFLVSGQLPASLSETHIALIPKVNNPELVSDFRSISLCNVLYRILAKVLANRFRTVLDSIISPSQSAFIPGRSIVDNVLIAYEANHALNRSQGSGSGCAALKVDMSKAYDRVEWGFLENVLNKLGFEERWIYLMRMGVSSVRYWVLMEGKEWGPILPTTGLRQGDPLSPCLFIIVAECLSEMMRVQEVEGALHGVRGILEDYGDASVKQVNLGKTSIIFGKSVHREDKEAVCEVLGISEHQGRGKYLGLPGLVGRKKREVLGFIRDKVRARILYWGNRFLSRAGREVFLKTVLQSIPNYAMNVFLLPKGLCTDIERLMNSFWRGCENRGGKGIRWGIWKDLCKPKSVGGMGFRAVREMNVAMLGKQGWKFLFNPNALVTRVFKARYFPHCSFLEAKAGSNPSFVWSSIRESQNLLPEGVRWRIGSGSEVKVWGDPWLPDIENPYVITLEPEYLNSPRVNSLFCPGTTCWDRDLIYGIFNSRDAQQILSVPTVTFPYFDCFYWVGESHRFYSVKSGYRLLTRCPVEEGVLDWTRVWKLDIPPKIKKIFWAMCTKRLPTKDALLVKQVTCDPTCVLCGGDSETTVHLFANCPFAKACWQEVDQGWRMGLMGSIEEWIEEMCMLLTHEIFEVVVLVCCALWENRNDLVWHAKSVDAKTLVARTNLYVQNWRQTRQSMMGSHNGLPGSQLSGTWHPPPAFYMKVNVDVAMDVLHERMGLGWVVRDAASLVVGVGLKLVEGLYSVREAEAMGAREALSWIKERGWSKIFVETDAQVVTHAVYGGSNLTPFGVIVDEIRVLLGSLDRVTIGFPKRSANETAHVLAHRALCNSGLALVELFDFIPRCISHTLGLN
ncbi:uncharacterized protein LOC116026999 [Ipomoea triloba]|uniref:uncharacterized protein LOC116026999 n=1 Tax=Ipomoea triloba TaxID=35885 RepID=UPI00125D7BE0|nr:uncharacterized protein LOC116026999 [Ipomoea triloba]